MCTMERHFVCSMLEARVMRKEVVFSVFAASDAAPDAESVRLVL